MLNTDKVLFLLLLFLIKCGTKSSAESENWQEVQKIREQLYVVLPESEKLNGPRKLTVILVKGYTLKVSPNGCFSPSMFSYKGASEE